MTLSALGERINMADSEATNFVVASRFGSNELHKYQKDMLDHLLKNRNVFVCQLTGPGKIMCYLGFSTALTKEDCIALVVSPLLSSMEEQVTYLKNLGIAAVLQGKCTKDDSRAKEGAFVYMYASPELLLATAEWRSVLKTFCEKIKLLVVDKAHLVTLW